MPDFRGDRRFAWALVLPALLTVAAVAVFPLLWTVWESLHRHDLRMPWLGRPFVGLNGGPNFKPNEAVSFMVVTEDQEETDRYWNAIVGNGGAESECGWCKDRWDISWQITPRVLMDALAAGGAEAKRAFGAMMTMKKIDVAAIEAARRG